VKVKTNTWRNAKFSYSIKGRTLFSSNALNESLLDFVCFFAFLCYRWSISMHGNGFQQYLEWFSTIHLNWCCCHLVRFPNCFRNCNLCKIMQHLCVCDMYESTQFYPICVCVNEKRNFSEVFSMIFNLLIII
jgi:hypothetical protein